MSYPLPLLSLTTHLALLNTRLPALVSQGDEDPLFNDDWAAAVSLFECSAHNRPPITLLVTSVGENAFYDPSGDELAVADAVLAISVVQTQSSNIPRIVSMRMVDPPSRLTAAGIPRDTGAAIGSTSSASHAAALAKRERDEGATVWRPPRGGLKRSVISQITNTVVKDGIVGQIFQSLAEVNS